MHPAAVSAFLVEDVLPEGRDPATIKKQHLQAKKLKMLLLKFHYGHYIENRCLKKSPPPRNGKFLPHGAAC